jgi:hypothetical protein
MTYYDTACPTSMHISFGARPQPIELSLDAKGIQGLVQVLTRGLPQTDTCLDDIFMMTRQSQQVRPNTSMFVHCTWHLRQLSCMEGRSLAALPPHLGK